MVGLSRGPDPAGAALPSRRVLSRLVLPVLAGLLAAAGCRPAVPAAAANVAVASNFKLLAEHLAADFAAHGGGRVEIVSGSTGKLFAQIVAGAPFDAFLAADEARPLRLERDGVAVAGSGFVYARGRLALWSADPGRLHGDGAAVLRRADFSRLAIANPELAPYGAAARDVLERLGLWQTLRPRLVSGENIGQAFALVATGNAELGFVALPQLVALPPGEAGSAWEVPPSLHAPIRQRAVLLSRAAGNATARAWLAYLRSAPARATIEAAGYALE